MNLDDIKQILEMMREHELSELELEHADFKVRLRKQGSGHAGVSVQHVAIPAPAVGTPPAVTTVAPAGSAASPPADDALELAVLKSPIVGTFYRSPEPGAKAFAEVGDTVRKGQVLCIIEAMKLMNEINAECDGEVVKVYVENGQAVQYGERLMAIRPA
jgi:acetyl-CoA carboxylase biotin carboxyl carrier protein